MVQQNIRKLRLSNTLRTIQEVLVDSVEEKRVGLSSGPQATSCESWKLLVTVKLSSTRYMAWGGGITRRGGVTRRKGRVTRRKGRGY